MQKRNTIHFLIFASGILAFILLMIYPGQMALNEMDEEIMKSSAQIEEQKILIPVLDNILKKEALLKEVEALPFPSLKSGVKLTLSDTGKISSIFQKMARDHQFQVKSARPDVKSLIDDSEYLIMTLVMQGNFFHLYNFLIQLSGIPYVAHVEEIRIDAVGKDREIRLKIWLAKE